MAEKPLLEFENTLKNREIFKKAVNLLGNNTDQSIEILNSLAVKGDPNAMCLLAEIYISGRYIEPNYKRGITLLKQAEKIGFKPALNNLGWMYQNGKGVLLNENKAFEYFLLSAKSGLAEGQFNVADAYHHGKGVSIDLIEATHWYRKAAIQGNKDSQFVLGKLYANKQPKESFRWMRMAADNGHTTAQYETAKAYLSGNGAPQNPTLAFNYLELAAKQDQPGGNFLLGELFYDGYGTSRNQEKGISLIKKAGNLGNQTAIKILPKLSVKKFDFLASLQKASDGDTNSIINLGWNYFEGINIGKNNIESYAWFNLAAEFTGDKKHIWARSFIAKQLSLDDLIIAKKRAKQISSIYQFKKPSELNNPPPHK